MSGFIARLTEVQIPAQTLSNCPIFLGTSCFPFQCLSMDDGADLKFVLRNKQGAGQEATSVCAVYPRGNQETAARITIIVLVLLSLGLPLWLRW